MLARKADNKLATTTITNQLIDEIGRIRGPIKSGEGRPTPAGRFTLAKVTTGVSGQSGRFNGRLQESEMKSDASGALVEADLGTFSSTDNCEVWDASQLDPELVFLIGQKTDGKLVFLRIDAGIQDIRYNTSIHNLQVTYVRNPVEADWLNRVQFDPCNTTPSFTRIGAGGFTGASRVLRELVSVSGAGEGGSDLITARRRFTGRANGNGRYELL